MQRQTALNLREKHQRKQCKQCYSLTAVICLLAWLIWSSPIAQEANVSIQAY
jgi:hypothetical protein